MDCRLAVARGISLATGRVAQMAVATATPSPTPPAPADSPEPAICTRCWGVGLVETCTFGVGLHEVRCPGVDDDDGSCDDGIVR